MALPTSRKEANAKWDSANMATVGCKLRKSQAEKFKAYCTAQGQTAHSVLKEYALECIGEADNGADGEARPLNVAPAAANSLVSAETLKTVQEHIKAQELTETPEAFITRAVNDTITRDKFQAGLDKEKQIKSVWHLTAREAKAE